MVSEVQRGIKSLQIQYRPCQQRAAVLRLRFRPLQAFRRPNAAPDAPGQSIGKNTKRNEEAGSNYRKKCMNVVYNKDSSMVSV